MVKKVTKMSENLEEILSAYNLSAEKAAIANFNDTDNYHDPNTPPPGDGDLWCKLKEACSDTQEIKHHLKEIYVENTPQGILLAWEAFIIQLF